MHFDNIEWIEMILNLKLEIMKLKLTKFRIKS